MSIAEISIILLNIAFGAVLGIAVGSFTNNWAYRLVRGRSVADGRSTCQSCGHVLGVAELIPVLSYLFLRGKCKHCKEKIAPRYLIVEIVSGILYAILAYRISPLANPLEFARWAVLMALLTTLALQDMETMELSDGIMIIILVLGIALIYWSPEGILWRAVSAFSISVPVLIVSLIMDKLMGMETMGGGDIKLFFVMGLHLSIRQMVFVLILSCIIGIILALATGGSKDIGEEVEDDGGKKHAIIPFGPSICIASYIAALWGDYLIDLYMSLFV